MKTSLFAMVIACFSGPLMAQPGDDVPAGWWQVGTPGAGYVVETAASSFGLKSVAVHAENASRTTFGGIGQAVSAAPYAGSRVQLTAKLKTLEVNGWSGLWVRLDAEDGRVITLDNMSDRGVYGTRPWRRQRVVLDVPEDAVRIVFGAIQNGSGRTWVDDFEIAPAQPGAVVTAGPSTYGYYNEPVYEHPPMAPDNLDFEL